MSTRKGKHSNACAPPDSVPRQHTLFPHGPSHHCIAYNRRVCKSLSKSFLTSCLHTIYRVLHRVFRPFGNHVRQRLCRSLSFTSCLYMVAERPVRCKRTKSTKTCVSAASLCLFFVRALSCVPTCFTCRMCPNASGAALLLARMLVMHSLALSALPLDARRHACFSLRGFELVEMRRHLTEPFPGHGA